MSYAFDKRKKTGRRATVQNIREDASRNRETLPNSLVMRIMQDQQAETEADKLSRSVTANTPDEVMQEMGSRLGADFSGVQFHSDSLSMSRSDAMGARAWAQGSDVYFGKGGFDPKVAAHELVHTVQQGAVRGDTAQSAPYGAVQLFRGEDDNAIHRRTAPANASNLELMTGQKNSTEFGPRVFNDLKKPIKTLAQKSGSRIRAVDENSGIAFLANLGERDYSGKEILRDIASRTVINKDEMYDRTDEYEGFLDFMKSRTDKVGLEAASLQAGILNGQPKYNHNNDPNTKKRAYEMTAQELANDTFNPAHDTEIDEALKKINAAQDEKAAYHAFLEYTEGKEFTRQEYDRSQRIVNFARQPIIRMTDDQGITKTIDPLVVEQMQMDIGQKISDANAEIAAAKKKGKNAVKGSAEYQAAKQEYENANAKLNAAMAEKTKAEKSMKIMYKPGGAPVNVPLLKLKLKNMVRQVRDYPELKHKIGGLNIQWNQVIGNYRQDKTSRIMSVQTSAGASEKTTITYDAYIDRDTPEAQADRDDYNNYLAKKQIGHLDKTGNHELGHILESTLNTDEESHKKGQASNDILQSVLPKVMTQQEMNQVRYNQADGKNEYDKKIYSGQIDTKSPIFTQKKMSSGYGQSMPKEWFAEAFHDVYTKGADAKPTSIEIVKEYERRQTAMQKSNFQKKKRGWFTNMMRGISKWFGFGTVHADQRMNPSNDMQPPVMPNVAPMPEMPDAGPAVQGPQLIEDNDFPDAVNKNHYEDNFLDKAMLADIKKKKKRKKKK